MMRGYEGGKVTRANRDWRGSHGDADNEISGDRTVLHARARDLVRNSAYGSAIVEAFATYLVGSGIRPRASTGNENFDRRIDEAWQEWQREVFPTSGLSFYALQDLAVRGMVEGGEVLLRKRLLNERMVVELLEPEYLDAAKDTLPFGLDGRGEAITRDAISFDESGRRTGYWILRDHPGGDRVTTYSDFVPADEIAHVYRPLRPGQQRGVTWFAPIIEKIWHLGKYERAEVMRKLGESMFVATHYADRPTPLNTTDRTTSAGNRIERLEPGMVNRIGLDEKFEFNRPSSTEGYEEHIAAQVRMVAAAVNLAYEVLRGDYSKVNFSSSRLAMNRFKRFCGKIQQQVIIPRLCQPVWEWFIDDLGLRTQGVVPMRTPNPSGVRWAAEVFESAQPLEDAKTAELDLKLGRVSWPQMVASLGRDPEDLIAEIEAWKSRLETAGIGPERKDQQEEQPGDGRADAA